MRKCSQCGRENHNSAIFCIYCGSDFEEKSSRPEVDAEVVNERDSLEEDLIKCPSCGSSKIQFLTINESNEYNTPNACCGFLLFGPLGLLCGLTGKNTSRTTRKCINCGYEF
jgi:DNA-directed RNA polymerase subunit M/transcription elongation factor TFIIS